jgi:hypothetical protein
MVTPLSEFTDIIQVGTTLIRSYNTGTLDTSSMTPRFKLFRRFDGADMGTVQSSKTDAFNWAFVIAYAVTNLLSPNFVYELSISFDDGNGNCIPHGIIHYIVSPGELHL